MNHDVGHKYCMINENGIGLSETYRLGVNEFIEFSLSKVDPTSAVLRSQCSKCGNKNVHPIDDIKKHLYVYVRFHRKIPRVVFSWGIV